MAQRTTHDVMVVGHGLAGTCLAIELERRGAKVLVFDHPMPGSASTAAAGLVNPVSLRRIVPVWRALEMLQKARAFYRSFEADSGVRLWHDMPLFKVFSTAEAASFWLRRATDPDLFDLVEDRVLLQEDQRTFHIPHGMGRVHGAAWLDVVGLLRAHVLQKANGTLFMTRDVAPQIVREHGNAVRVHEHSAGWLVWCTGAFAHLPGLIPVKGEGLTLRVPGVDPDRIMQQQAFAIPIGKGLVKLGSTYVWEDVFSGPSNEGRSQLIQRAKALFHAEFRIEDQWWGVRPTARDRRPLLGTISERQAVFNGLGSRGVLLAPWCAGHLADHLLEGSALDPEVDRSRFG